MTIETESRQEISQPQPAAVTPTVEFRNVSKFYGDVLGVNRVNLSIPPGITSLVGPNGSGKTTLMNLMTGLIRPTCGDIRVLGLFLFRSRTFLSRGRLLHAVRLISRKASPDESSSSTH